MLEMAWEMPWFPVRVRDWYSVVVRSHGGDVTPNNNVLCCATAVFCLMDSAIVI